MQTSNSDLNIQNEQTAFQVVIASGKNYASLSFFDEISKTSLDNSFLTLLNHPKFKRNMNACYDYSSAYSGLSMQEIEEHAHFVSQNLKLRGGNYKLALISNDTLNNALLSVYKLLIAKTSVEAEVFSHKTKAIEWLMLE
jgi:predicted DNA binding protein